MSKGLAKIAIINLDGGPNITAEFNPKELSFSKSVGWSDDSQGMSTNFPRLQFTAGKSIKLSVELLFDKYEESGDVRGIVQSVMQLALIREDLKRPPMIQLLWGHTDVLFTGGQFTGVVTDVTTKYTMFLSNGTPCRAVVTIAMTQAEEVLSAEDGGSAILSKTKGLTQTPEVLAASVGENASIKSIQEKFPNNWKDILSGIDNPEDPEQIKNAIIGGMIVAKPVVSYEKVEVEKKDAGETAAE